MCSSRHWPQKLTYVSAARIPSEKAHTHQILQMCDAFSACGLDVELLHPRRDNTPAMDGIENVWQHYGLQQRFSLTEIPTVDLLLRTRLLLDGLPDAIRRPGLRLAFELLMATYARSLPSYLGSSAGGAYYVRGFRVFHSMVSCRPELGSATFFEAHDEFPQSPKVREARGKHLGKAAGIIATNQYIKDLYCSCGIRPDDVLVAPNGVDIRRIAGISLTKQQARARLALPSDRYIIGYVGRLETLGKEKGLSDLISALTGIYRDHQSQDPVLCLVGGPAKRIRQYRELSQQLGLNKDALFFTGQVPPKDVPAFLRAFDLCAMPFPWTEHYAYYMSPLKLFEYMASGRPIIATHLPSIRGILRHKHTAYLVPPDDPDALAEGIRWLSAHPSLARQMARRARAEVQEHTWERRAERILKFMGRASQRPTRVR